MPLVVEEISKSIVEEEGFAVKAERVTVKIGYEGVVKLILVEAIEVSIGNPFIDSL